MLSSVSMKTLSTGLCVALVASFLPLADAWAGVKGDASSVEVYPGASPEEGVLPSGMSWNHPLKAGDLMLLKKTPPRQTEDKKAEALSQPPLPVGEVKAPLVGGQGSSASIMLLQGMQNSMQQIGAGKPPVREPLKASGGPLSLLSADQPVQSQESAEPAAPLVESQDGVVFEQGRGPRELAAPEGAQESATIDQARQAFEEESSIFGAPVPEANVAPGRHSSADGCVPQVTKWARTCGQAGYPETFVGNVLGETRVTCPSGETRDVWLSNTCSSPTASAEHETARVEEEPSILMPRDDEPLDASCGTSNGLPARSAPQAFLCVRGNPTSVAGTGPWRWSCQGLRGGVTVSCAAPVAPGAENQAAAKEEEETPTVQDGVCGTASGTPVAKAPHADLCAKGSASRVSGTGPWTWACSGLNGGKAMACAAPAKIDGKCGAAETGYGEGMPERDLCAAGYASAVTGDGPWAWTCSGLYGGGAATCEARPKVNAVCGEASMKGHTKAPSDELCSAGKPSRVSGTGPWSWSCDGARGGASVSCTGPLQLDGRCGSAHGGQFSEAPESELCVAGTASRVTGFGPWNWTCSGLNGGATESCTATVGEQTPQVLAPVKMPETTSESSTPGSSAKCGPASRTLPFSKPTEKLCDKGTSSAVGGEGPWAWICTDSNDLSVSCSTLGPVDGACGAAAAKTAEAPNEDLCRNGMASAVAFDKGEKAWLWTCEGTMGGGKASCSAPASKTALKMIEEKEETGACGAAAGRAMTAKPTEELCKIGNPSPVRGTGPWSWTCAGKKGANAVCEAALIADGMCGASNGSIQASAPTSSLCDAGRATEVKGEGPWLWSCVGEGGGMSVSCSAASQAQARIDGTCGASANAIMTTAPKANLCDTGIASSVYGEGPWTWTCSGTNGGIASTCTSSKVMPKAPLPPGPRVDGLCGFANGVAMNMAPQEGLCSAGTLSAMSGDGPWNWSCLGENGGMTVSCTAPLMPPSPIVGVCGAASGVPTLTIPKSGLCSSGISSAVSGKGPWTWSCSGTNGGGAVSCVAPYAKASSRPQPSLVTPSGEPAVPHAAPAGLVTPQLPQGPLKPIKSDMMPNLKFMKSDGQTLPEVVQEPELPKVPSYKPSLPEGEEPEAQVEVEEDHRILDGQNPPILDGEGKPVAGARLNLKEDVSMIAFDHGSDQLSADAVERLEKLAAILRANNGVRITLVGYASIEGRIDPRVARKVSLNRALSIRDFLVSKGVANKRIDVRPMGGNVPSGDMDRVDVVVN